MAEHSTFTRSAPSPGSVAISTSVLDPPQRIHGPGVTKADTFPSGNLSSMIRDPDGAVGTRPILKDISCRRLIPVATPSPPIVKPATLDAGTSNIGRRNGQHKQALRDEGWVQVQPRKGKTSAAKNAPGISPRPLASSVGFDEPPSLSLIPQNPAHAEPNNAPDPAQPPPSLDFVPDQYPCPDQITTGSDSTPTNFPLVGEDLSPSSDHPRCIDIPQPQAISSSVRPLQAEAWTPVNRNKGKPRLAKASTLPNPPSDHSQEATPRTDASLPSAHNPLNTFAGEGHILQPDSDITTDQPRPAPLLSGMDTIGSPASLGTDRTFSKASVSGTSTSPLRPLGQVEDHELNPQSSSEGYGHSGALDAMLLMAGISSARPSFLRRFLLHFRVSSGGGIGGWFDGMDGTRDCSSLARARCSFELPVDRDLGSLSATLLLFSVLVLIFG
ncbi:hypothetical protein NL676_039299 [Syzygium grande]|nr:hypothetical protein NL676_039299 [Syzygium grande]